MVVWALAVKPRQNRVRLKCGMKNICYLFQLRCYKPDFRNLCPRKHKARPIIPVITAYMIDVIDPGYKYGDSY